MISTRSDDRVLILMISLNSQVTQWLPLPTPAPQGLLGLRRAEPISGGRSPWWLPHLTHRHNFLGMGKAVPGACLNFQVTLITASSPQPATSTFSWLGEDSAQCPLSPGAHHLPVPASTHCMVSSGGGRWCSVTASAYQWPPVPRACSCPMPSLSANTGSHQCPPVLTNTL